MDQAAIDAYNTRLKEEADRKEELTTVIGVGDTVRQAIEYSTTRLIANDRGRTRNVKIENDLATPEDIDRVVTTLRSLESTLKPEEVSFEPLIGALESIGEKLDSLPKAFPEMPEAPESVKINNLSDIVEPLKESIDSLNFTPVFDPKIEVKPADVNVTTEKLDLKPLLSAVEGLKKAFDSLASKEQPETDISPIIEATKATTKAIKSLTFPVPNYVLPYLKDGKSTQLALNSDGSVPIGSTNYETRFKVDSVTPTLYYSGKAAIGSADSDATWQIRAIDTSVGANKYWPEDAGTPTDEFTFVWDSREGYTYS